MAQRLVKKISKIFYILLVISVFGCTNKFTWVETLKKPWLLSADEINEILPKFIEKFPDFENRLKAITLWRIGTPYEEFKLGEEIPPDTDPIFRLDVSDCTVHVLTSLALAQSDSWEQARKNIIEIHYKSDGNGIHTPTYKSRWHFTSDRILFNPSTVNITDELITNNLLKSTDIILNKKEDGSKLLDINWNEKVRIAYLPNKSINNELLSKLPEVCGIAFVRESYFKNGLAIAHEGILINQKYLVHASSVEWKTVKVDFLEYYFKNDKPIFDGIIIYKFVPLK